MYKKEEYILKKNIGFSLVAILEKHNCILAGGAITSIFSGNYIKDYDIYFHDRKDLEALKKEFIRTPLDRRLEGSVKLLCETENALTYSIDNKTFQLIHLEELMCLETKKIIEQFDFTVCMGAYDFSTKSFVFNENFLKDLSQRSLVYNTNSKYPFASLYRAIKYIKKGFKISGIEMLKLGLKCNNIQINNFENLSRQLMGVDTLFLKALTDKLSSSEMAEKLYDFDVFLQMMDEHLSEVSEFNVEE